MESHECPKIDMVIEKYVGNDVKQHLNFALIDGDLMIMLKLNGIINNYTKYCNYACQIVS
jgi:hypothetical protein